MFALTCDMQKIFSTQLENDDDGARRKRIELQTNYEQQQNQ